MEATIEIRRAEAIPGALRAQIDDWHRIEFGLGLDRLAPAVWRVLAWQGDALACHVGLVDAAVTVGGQPLRLGGVSGVITDPAWRGRGIATATLRAAQAHLRDGMGVPFGLLLCGRHRVTFYERLGWQVTDSPLTFVDGQGERVIAGHVCMVLPLRDCSWPEGAIDLGGLPW